MNRLRLILIVLAACILASVAGARIGRAFQKPAIRNVEESVRASRFHQLIQLDKTKTPLGQKVKTLSADQRQEIFDRLQAIRKALAANHSRMLGVKAKMKTARFRKIAMQIDDYDYVVKQEGVYAETIDSIGHELESITEEIPPDFNGLWEWIYEHSLQDLYDIADQIAGDAASCAVETRITVGMEAQFELQMDIHILEQIKPIIGQMVDGAFENLKVANEIINLAEFFERVF